MGVSFSHFQLPGLFREVTNEADPSRETIQSQDTDTGWTFPSNPPHCNCSHFSLVQPCDKGWQLHKGTTLIAFNFSPAVEGSGAHFFPPEDRELFPSRSFLNLDYSRFFFFFYGNCAASKSGLPSLKQSESFNDNKKKKTQRDGGALLKGGIKTILNGTEEPRCFLNKAAPSSSLIWSQ